MRLVAIIATPGSIGLEERVAAAGMCRDPGLGTVDVLTLSGGLQKNSGSGKPEDGAGVGVRKVGERLATNVDRLLRGSLVGGSGGRSFKEGESCGDLAGPTLRGDIADLQILPLPLCFDPPAQ